MSHVSSSEKKPNRVIAVNNSMNLHSLDFLPRCLSFVERAIVVFGHFHPFVIFYQARSALVRDGTNFAFGFCAGAAFPVWDV